MRKKLLIDINTVVPYFALGQISGIGRTTLELVRALDKIPEEEIDFEIMLWAQNLKGIGAKELKTRFTNKHLWMRHCGFMDRIAYSMKLRERLTNYDAIHVPHNYEPVPDPSKLILTIHDVMFYTHPEKDFNIEYYKQ